jgi:hypothetical protein
MILTAKASLQGDLLRLRNNRLNHYSQTHQKDTFPGIKTSANFESFTKSLQCAMYNTVYC